jgi:hypothetical protein
MTTKWSLLVVGWYLLMPLPREYGGVFVPLKQWGQMGVFDTAKECSEAYQSAVKELQEERRLCREDQRLCLKISMDGFLTLNQRCIASDDPRLKDR